MTPEDVAKRVADISKMVGDYETAGDDEKAHSYEDQLHQDVLRAIADGTAIDSAACAAKALETLSLDFERWCA